MKRSFSIIGSFCLGLFISVAIIACADDTNETPPITAIIDNSALPTVYEMSVTYDEDFTSVKYSYNQNGRISSITYSSSFGIGSMIFTVDYSNNTITLNGECKYQITVSEEDMSNPKATNALIYMIFADNI